jgi:cytochrome d ubiquinol oxidase subunit I
MINLDLARMQFAATTIYHFFFVPLTLGLSILVALMQTAYYRTGDEDYKSMAKFWGKLFVINFAMGVVTGIVMEFQFGMNWSQYSRFVGDIFGIPLAIEALSAFFLESVFIGVWIFGWNRLSKGMHLASIWLVAIASNLSAFWILVANSWMQQPVGFELVDGKAVLVDFPALITNPNVWVQFPHVIAAGMTTAAFFVLGISAFNLLRKGKGSEIFLRSFRWGTVYALIGTVLVILVGHSQAQHMVEVQPMKMAAAEALWETEDPASLSLFTISNESERRDIWTLRIPNALSLLAFNQLDGEVKGINELQTEYEQTYGPGDYVPPVAISYWSFRIMVGAGFLMLLIAMISLYFVVRDRIERASLLLKVLPFLVVLPYLANTAGWLLTELGRQPWIVFGLQKTAEGVSNTVSAAMVGVSLLVYTLVYTALIGATVYLLAKYARFDQTKQDLDVLPVT